MGVSLLFSGAGGGDGQMLWPKRGALFRRKSAFELPYMGTRRLCA